jgi:hypothetical protein
MRTCFQKLGQLHLGSSGKGDVGFHSNLAPQFSQHVIEVKFDDSLVDCDDDLNEEIAFENRCSKSIFLRARDLAERSDFWDGDRGHRGRFED